MNNEKVYTLSIDPIDGDGRGGEFFNTITPFTTDEGVVIEDYDGYEMDEDWDDFGSQFITATVTGTLEQLREYIARAAQTCKQYEGDQYTEDDEEYDYDLSLTIEVMNESKGTKEEFYDEYLLKALSSPNKYIRKWAQETQKEREKVGKKGSRRKKD